MDRGGPGTAYRRPQAADPDLRHLHTDVLIVGAGSAGSVVAERISADSSCHVAVVETGPAPFDPKVSAQITDALRMPIGAASSVVRHYASTLTEDPKRIGHIMRGAVVGGSGAVNGGYFCRALPEDFESWALPGWSWADVLHISAQLRTISTSSVRCTDRTGRYSFAACLNSTAAQHRS